jgi:hypothetical protein
MLYSNRFEERGDVFLHLLRVKMHQQFAYSVGDKNHNAHYQFVRQKCKCMFCWSQPKDN